jgi:hypothetical protein
MTLSLLYTTNSPDAVQRHPLQNNEMLGKLPERFRVRTFTLIKTIRSLYSTAVRPSSCPEISSNFQSLRI